VPLPPGALVGYRARARVTGNSVTQHSGQGDEIGRQATARCPRLRQLQARAHTDGVTLRGISVNHGGSLPLSY